MHMSMAYQIESLYQLDHHVIFMKYQYELMNNQLNYLKNQPMQYLQMELILIKLNHIQLS